MIEVGSASGVYDTNSVRDRVRQWQAQGGGVVVTDDMDGGEDDRVADFTRKQRARRKSSIPRTPSRSELEVYSSTKRTEITRKGSRENRQSKYRNGNGSAPAKRVISDGRWRRKKSPPKTTISPSTSRESAPLLNRENDGKRSKSPSPSTKKINGAKTCDEKETTMRENGPYVGDGCRAYVTPHSSRRDSEHPQKRKCAFLGSESGNKRDLEASRAGSVTESLDGEEQSIAENSSQIISPNSNKGSTRHRSGERRSMHPSHSPRSPRGSIAKNKRDVRSHKGNILSSVFGDSQRVPITKTTESIPISRIPSIQAWLNETQDPFIDAKDPIIELATTCETLRGEDKNVANVVVAEDPNKIWDALDTKEGTRRAVRGSKKKRRIPSSAIYIDNPFSADFDSESVQHGPGKGIASASKFIDLAQAASGKSLPSLERPPTSESASLPHPQKSGLCASSEIIHEDDATSASSSRHTSFSAAGPLLNDIFRPPGLKLKRPFPSAGAHRLSTIASVDTIDIRPNEAPVSESEITETPADRCEIANETRGYLNPTSLKPKRSSLTKHADLISVLSLPKAGNESIQSARSIRTSRSRLATATTGDLMQELATDEIKYMRELRTLVDGVIPVLLTCVLSKSDSAVAAGLFQPLAHTHEDPNFTRPIVDMGIALERLKTLHKRIPQGDPAALLTWAHGAQRVYSEYLRAWRMGFQDVVVNLAPATERSHTLVSTPNVDTQSLNEGLPRNADGDVVNGDGDRVDVAFLLKRPLVRLKYLAKTIKGIQFLQPSIEAELLAVKYQKLVGDARQRSNEERARLEDEAASNIDPTRARDPRTLAPLAGVIINQTRRVRARDQFNLTLQHSSGQCMDCRVELLLRDEPSEESRKGDLLICEIDGTGRWLLFPPIQSARVSARNGDLKGEVVIMITGVSGKGIEWHELLSLRSEDENMGFEWVQMLGLSPIPFRIVRSQNFLDKHQGSNVTQTKPIILASSTTPTKASKNSTPSPGDLDVPIGEQANASCWTWVETLGDRPTAKCTIDSPQEPQEPDNRPDVALPTFHTTTSTDSASQVGDLCSIPGEARMQDPVLSGSNRAPRSFKEALGLSGTSTTVGLKRAKAKRRSKHGGSLPSSSRPVDASHEDDKPPAIPSGNRKTVQTRRSATEGLPHDLSPQFSDERPTCSPQQSSEQKGGAQPTNRRTRSSVPSIDIPYIPKARKRSPPPTPNFEVEEEPVWPSPLEPTELPSTSKLAKRRPSSPKPASSPEPSLSIIPVHPSSSQIQLGEKITPIFSKSQTKPRRSSSPLKHEYEPSTASESYSDSETSTVERNDIVSISSEDEDLEDDVPTPLIPLAALKQLAKAKAATSTSSQSTPDRTIKPSESASQAPFRYVPPQPTKASKTIASIFSWSDTGSWQSLHPDECSIVISPGLIEAYEMSAAHSASARPSSLNPVVEAEAFPDHASTLTSQNDEVRGDRPLVALELTPLVPIRRGTALDIAIRSPPTSNSQITSGSNIMFRSRNPEECEALYALINYSRINNPTFIALQNARPFGNPFSGGRRASANAGGSRHGWFTGLGRSSSYRAKSVPTPSIMPSESSIGSMSSAFSALRRFGRGSGMFNISRSTIFSREGSRANSIYTSSDNSSGSGTSTPVPPGTIGTGKDAPIGLSNAKIRLYARETASRWRDMGSARLTILHPEKQDTHQGVHEKRIVINGKTKGEILLDVQLGESCFERVARTGIALSVWEDVVGPNGEVGIVQAVGGVGGGRAKVYMIQMKSEAETAYTFSIVGKFRY